jgi:replicative DNA helicase Mcm
VVAEVVAEDEDRDVVDHMMRSRRAAARKALREELTDAEWRNIEPAIPRDLLRTYIAYAKEEVTPDVRASDDDAQEYLKEEFLEFRLANAEDEDNLVPVTFQKEEAVGRLAEASARIRLDDQVSKDDIGRALRIVRKSMRQIGVDLETGEFDADVIETGQSESQRNRRKQVLAIVDDRNGIAKEDLLEIAEAPPGKLLNDITKLKERGQLIECQGNLWRTKDY